jgi:peptidoglycan-N-acetylglucosamine deacetylase
MPVSDVQTRRAVIRGGLACAASALVPCMAWGQHGPRAHVPPRAFPTGQDGAVVDRIRYVTTQDPVIAMTFDDGPHHALTPQVLDILAARGIKASFFVVGHRVVQAPGLVARIAREGHEIGNHSWSHPHLARLGDHAVLSEIDKTADAVLGATGFRPVVMRPPYGDFNTRQSRMLRAARDLPTIMWSVDPQDWRRPGGRVIAERIIAHAAPGAVILTHDTVSDTVRSLPHALDALLGQGYRFVTVSELIGWPAWTRRGTARG